MVTGALGNIGRRISGRLATEYDLTLTDLRASAEHPDVIAADLLDFSSVERLMAGMDAVVHMAIAPGGTLRKQDVPGEVDPVDESAVRINTTSAFHVLEAARRHQVKRVVYASSMTIVLGDRHREKYDESTPINPLNLYACTKLFGENVAELAWKVHGLKTICLRFGQPTPINHEYDDLWQNNKRARSWFVHIDDIATSVICALRTNVPFGIYDVVSATDNPRVDWQKARADIGYIPRAYFADAGLSFHDNGDFPPHDGSIVTHCPHELAQS